MGDREVLAQVILHILALLFALFGELRIRKFIILRNVVGCFSVFDGVSENEAHEFIKLYVRLIRITVGAILYFKQDNTFQEESATLNAISIGVCKVVVVIRTLLLLRNNDVSD